MADYAVVVAGGSGESFRGALPKQFVGFLGHPLLYYGLKTLEESPAIDGVVLVMHPDHMARARDLVNGSAFEKVRQIVPGGVSRQLSVRSGLEFLAAANPRFVLIHDAARPFFSGELVSSVIGKLRHRRAVVPLLSSRDALLRVAPSGRISYLDRNPVKQVQTPQGFHFEDILRAHREAFRRKYHDAPDDLSILKRYLRLEPFFVEGEPLNFKVTFPGELERFEEILERFAASREK